MRRARQAADRQVKARRAVLAFVVPIRREIEHRVGLPESLSTCDDAVNLGIAAPAALVVQVPGSPTHATTRPCWIRRACSVCSASHVIEPIVPGMKRKRYV